MKKSHLRNISWALLLSISLSAYLYLINEPTEQYQDYYVEQSTPESEELDVENNWLLLPDVALVKEIIQMTRMILHGH